MNNSIQMQQRAGTVAMLRYDDITVSFLVEICGKLHQYRLKPQTIEITNFIEK
jgi:hypothetical protein